MTERKVTQIKNYLGFKKLRIAVYCRVSTQNKEQLKSLGNQISYYKEMVKRHLDWELVDIYTDVRSGKNTSGRHEFKRMLKDCENHKIDMIITKSVSRFGRNIEDTLSVLNELRRLLVDVYFENEKINTSDTRQDFLISILEIAAQAENKARSKNIKWGFKRKAESGTSKLYDRKCYGYDKDNQGMLIIKPDESHVVKMIFDLYLRGYSIIAIIRELGKQGIKSPTGNDQWSKRTIDTILSNEKYVGSVILGKTYSDNFKSEERKINRGDHEKYIMTNNHPPIISKELFDLVQTEKLRRSNTEIDGKNIRRKSTHYSMKKST